MVIQRIVSKLPYLNDWRTFTILGTSFPKTMRGIRKGGEIVPRDEWKLYKILVAGFRKIGLRLPAFGDYAINHPEIPELDWRVVKPYATIRYTIDNAWYIVKGDNIRDEKNEERKVYKKGRKAYFARKAEKESAKKLSAKHPRQQVADPNQVQNVSDDLAEVITAWPKLSLETRKAIIKMVR